MSDLSKKEVIEKLAGMQEFIQNIAQEYNKLAKDINLESRMAIMTSAANDWIGEEYKNTDQDEYKKYRLEDGSVDWERAVGDWQLDLSPSKDINRCGANAWFPSAICY